MAFLPHTKVWCSRNAVLQPNLRQAIPHSAAEACILFYTSDTDAAWIGRPEAHAPTPTLVTGLLVQVPHHPSSWRTLSIRPVLPRLTWKLRKIGINRHLGNKVLCWRRRGPRNTP